MTDEHPGGDEHVGSDVPPIPETSDAPMGPAPAPPPTTARSVAVTSVRLIGGVVGSAIAVIALAVVALTPAGGAPAPAPAVTVTPEPAAFSRVCPGALLELGGDDGDSAATASSVGRAAVVARATGARLDRTTVTPSASDAQLLEASAASGALLAGAQSQSVSTDDMLGLATAACADPTGVSWLVGGATTTGRTSLVVITNPTAVDATVQLRIWTEKGAVDAPGLRGIIVKAGSQQVLSLAGYVQDAASTVVEVLSTGGQVAATLQESIVRGVDPGGVDIASPSTTADRLVIPGVVIAGSGAVNALAGRDDYGDLAPIIRLLSADGDTTVHVGLTSSTGGKGAAFDVPVSQGKVTDVPLASGASGGDGDPQLVADGTYTVTLEADEPIAAGVRVATALPLTGTDPLASPITDIAWSAPAPLIDTSTLVATPSVASVIEVQNPSSKSVTVAFRGVDGTADLSLSVPAGASASVAAAPGGVYRVTPPTGIRIAVTTVGQGTIAGYPVAPPPSLASSLVVRP